MSFRPEDLLAHTDWARGLARRLVVDDATADDVVQETFAATLRRPPTQAGPLRPWLGRVLGNVVRRRTRGEGRRERRERAVARAEALPSAAELTERTEAHRLLADALLELDEATREVVLLRYYEGLSSAEIARRHGIPAGTVRWRLKQGLDALRARLDARFDGDSARWHLALAPLVVEHAFVGAGLVAPLAGVFMMKIAVTVAAIAAFVLLLGFALVAIGTIESPFADPPREPVAYKPLVVAELDVEQSASPAAVVVREPAPRKRDAAADERVTVHMRFVDPRGEVVAGVEVRPSPSSGEMATSDADGCARLAYVPFGPRGEVSIHYRAIGFANDAFEVAGRTGDVVDVGDVRLHAGGAISGTVVDENAVPLAGMVVEAPGREVTAPAGGGMRMSRSTDRGAARARTDAQGAFRLEGVLTGDVRLRVRSDDRLREGESGLVEVRAGQESSGVVIIAVQVPADSRIEGVVLDPDGAPVPWARIQARYSTFFSGGSLSAAADREGRFRLILSSGARHDLVVRGKNGEWNPVVAKGVAPGTLDLVLRFRPAGEAELLLVDAAGRAIPRAAFAVRSADGELHQQWVDERPLKDGRVGFRRPSERFEIEVLAPGFAARVVGPFEPAALGAEPLRVELNKLPGIVGSVRHEGAPMANVRVTAYRLARQRAFCDGLPTWLDTSPKAEMTTDAEGRFELTVRESGDFVVRAEREGVAPAEFGPFAYQPAIGISGVAVNLTPGGTIEGRVRRANGVARTSLVLASRGDGHARTVRTKVDGMYRFEHLMPGPWQLLVVDDESAFERGSASSEQGAPFTAIDADCYVVEGGVTYHNLGEEVVDAAVLVGGFTIVGKSMADWHAAVVPAESRGRVDAREPVTLEANGSFRIGTAAPGRVSLVIESGRDDVSLRFLCELDLPMGESRWSQSVELGALVLTSLPAGETPLAVLWRGGDGLFAVAMLPGAEPADGELKTVVPAGAVEIVRFDRGSTDDPRSWPVLARASVPVGGEVRVDL